MDEFIVNALEKMNRNYCKISQIRYKDIKCTNSLIENLKKEKYLECPIAYEFYHQFRILIEKQNVMFGEYVVQAE